MTKSSEYCEGMHKDILTPGDWYLLPFFQNSSVVVSKGEPAENPKWPVKRLSHKFPLSN